MYLSSVSKIGVSLMACSLRIDSQEHCTVCSGTAVKYKPFRWYRSKAANHTVRARNTPEKPNVQFISSGITRVVALTSLGA